MRNTKHTSLKASSGGPPLRLSCSFSYNLQDNGILVVMRFLAVPSNVIFHRLVDMTSWECN